MHNVPILTAAMDYDDHRDGTTYILILGQAIYMGDSVNATIIYPNQLRSHGIVVDDVPIHLSPITNPSRHEIYHPEQDVYIPLSLSGIISYFDTRQPTMQEIESCHWIVLSNEFNWDPHSSEFHEQECLAQCHDQHLATEPRHIYSIKSILNNDTIMHEISGSFDDKKFLIAASKTSHCSSDVSPEKLAQRWGIGLQVATQALKVTTQKGVRNVVYPFERRFKTKQAQLRYNQLSGRHRTFYTDTFFSTTASLNDCSMAQIYCNDIGFTKIYPMRIASQAGDSLSTFLHDIGIPNHIHSDMPKN
jgi:hypothetical protein